MKSFLKIVLLQALVFILLLSSCLTHKKIYTTNMFLNTFDLKIAQVRAFELSKNSKEKIGQTFTIGDGLYPNDKRFSLEHPMVFNNEEKPNFKTESNYFYTKEGSVKAILYQWDSLKPHGLIFGENYKISIVEVDTNETYKVFQEKFEDLKTDLVAELGEPEIDNSGDGDSFRKGLKWKTNKLNAYLMLFGNSSQSYRQVRLVIYKD